MPNPAQMKILKTQKKLVENLQNPKCHPETYYFVKTVLCYQNLTI